MREMLSEQEARKRIKKILFGAGFSSAILLACGFTEAAFGVWLGAAVGIFNYRLVVKVVLDQSLDPETKKQNRFMKRYLLRLLFSAVVLGTAVFIGTDFLLGVLLGLLLEMLTYILEAFKLFITGKATGKKRG
ncbi:MAG TPA: hypothetical protein GX711_03060 [Clostridia bacterium]|nr:hypothetical protein [Clostridia bacterium]